MPCARTQVPYFWGTKNKAVKKNQHVLGMGYKGGRKRQDDRGEQEASQRGSCASNKEFKLDVIDGGIP